MQDFIPLFLAFESNKIIYGHLFISTIISIFATLVLKNRYNIQIYKLFLVIFAFNVFLPILSYIITIFLSSILAYTEDKRYLKKIKKFNIDEFLNNKFPIVNRVFGEATVTNISNNTNSSAQKMKSLVFLSNNPDKKNFPIIKKLLSDKDNEVRLFSFSLLNSFENELSSKIASKLEEFKSEKDEKKRSIIAGELAHLNWDFIYYGFSNLESEGLLIENTEHFLNIALKNEEEKGMQNLLLGKVQLYKKDYNNATKSLKLAISHGVKKSIVNFYLAEIAYEKKAYLEIKPLLKEIKTIETSIMTAPIHKQWVLT